MLEPLASRVAAFGDDVDDFTLRKTCLDDPETLAFQRRHPKLYWMVTDRKLIKEDKFRNAVKGLLTVRERVEVGDVSDEHEADAMATRTVLAAMGASHVRDAQA